MAEARRQARLVDRIAGTFASEIAREITDATIQAVNVWEQAGEVPPIRSDRFDAVYARMATAAVVAFGERIAEQAQRKSFADLMRRFALQYISGEAIRRRIVAIAETTRRQIINAIEKGYRDGLGQRAIAQGIRERAPEIANYRSQVIARTEVHGAANAGSMEAARQSGLPLRRVWVSVEDHRTRDFLDGNDGRIAEFDHRSMNGQTRGMQEPFAMPRVDGTSIPAMFPGDPSLPPAACINCRCAIAYDVTLGDLF